MILGEYAPEHVRLLIEEYAALRECVDTTAAGLRILVQLADLDRALDRLSLKPWEVVLAHGLLGFSQEEAAGQLAVSQQAVSKRYRHAVEEITYLMNGGD